MSAENCLHPDLSLTTSYCDSSLAIARNASSIFQHVNTHDERTGNQHSAFPEDFHVQATEESVVFQPLLIGSR